MATYLINDLYSTSGSAKLFGCWTDHVTKFHSGSFYNFEQDNLPLYDLDDRTELLWEQLGYPTSAIPGMVLLVSADAPMGEIGCNRNIFPDLSSLTKVLPKYINYPMIIEVANFGELGNLDLTDITMGPSGSLEIINRLTYAPPVLSGIECSGQNAVTGGPHGDYSTLWNDIQTKSSDSLWKFFTNTANSAPSSVLLGAPVFAATAPNVDSRISTDPVYKAFYGSRPTGTYTGMEFGRLSVADLDVPSVFNTTGTTVTATVFEEGAGDEVTLYDPSAFSQVGGYSFSNELYRDYVANFGLAPGADNTLRLVAYGNYLDRIVVSNCNGPIYIRGFFCKGDGSTDKIGVDVKDSTVNFETLAVDHFVDKGIRIKNSTVSFMRDLFVNRCYGLDSSNKRLSKEWLINSQGYEAPRDDSAGIEAVNSELFFDTTEEHTSNLGSGTFLAGLYLRVISRNSTGLRLINSTVRGGKPKEVATINSVSGSMYADILSIEGNANYGIEMHNSNFRFDGRLEVYHNTRGIKSIHSELELEEFTIEKNHLYGIKIEDTQVTYNINGISAVDRYDYNSTTLNPQSTFKKQYMYKFDSNGQHIVMTNSNFKPMRYNGGMEKYYGRMIFLDAHGITNDTVGSFLPSVDLDSSLLEVIHGSYFRGGETDKIAKGAHVLAKNNSEYVSLGTASSMGAYLGGTGNPNYAQMKYYVALCAENNSTLRFRGPNVIWDGAVNVYANKNSNIIFEPHKKQNGEFDLSGFTLTDPKNHTMIEMKGYNSCIVVDNNSNLTVEDLGDYHVHWSDDYIADTNYNTSTLLNFAPYTSAGFFQMYPNPNEVGAYSDFPQVLEGRGTSCRMTADGDRFYFGGTGPWTSDPYALTGVTQGGMCLRALNNSNVRVRNVHFPCGWWNASSVYYNVSASDEFCSRTFIWNIANNSTLHLDHVSVSGVYPASAGYHGPSAIYFSAAGAANYGAPSSTPDTSSLSVLDFFGCGSGINAWYLPNGTYTQYGQSTFENQGPFRLYVGVDSMANSLVHGGGTGAIQQIYAQGYNPSGSAFCVADTSATYGKLIKISEVDGTLTASGFYYGNEFVFCDPNSILLDESGSNFFANAKNGAMGSSNRPQICTIYSAKTTRYGESRNAAAGIVGKGFRSCNLFDLLEES